MKVANLSVFCNYCCSAHQTTRLFNNLVPNVLSQRWFIGQHILIMDIQREKVVEQKIIAHRQHKEMLINTKQMYIGVLLWTCACYVSDCFCLSPLQGKLCRRKCCDEVMSLRWSHSSTSMSLAVQLPFHKEIALLFEVDVTIWANKATGVTIFVPCFHHRPTAVQRTDGNVKNTHRNES